MTYTAKYTTDDIESMTIDVFGTAVNSAVDWVDLLVLLAIVGVALSVIAGILYKVSRIMGL
jgi:hypothetical protein